MMDKPIDSNSEKDAAGLSAAIGDKLRSSGDILEVLLEGSPNMIFINVDGRIVYANRRCEEMTGFRKAEFYSDDFDFFRLIAPEYRDLIQKNFQRHIRGENIDPYEYAIITKSGDRIQAILTSHLISYDGKTGVLGCITDITQRKLAEKALRESEEKYRKLFKNAPVGIGIADLEGNLLDFNDSILEPGGYSREDIEKIQKISELYYSVEERKRILEIAGKQGYIDDAGVRFKRKDGTPYEAVLSLRPIQIGGKEVWQAIVQDVTAKTMAERALLESRKRWQDIFNYAGVGIFQTDEEGKFTLVNPKLARMFGYETPLDFLRSVAVMDQLYLEPAEHSMLQGRIKLNGFVDGAEARFRKKDGKTIWLRISARRIENSSGKDVYEGSMLDITENHLAEETLKQSEQKYRTVLESNPDPIVFYDSEGRVIYFNPAFSRVFGWTLAERIGQKMDIFVPDENLPETRGMMQKVAEGQGFAGLETKRFNKKGEIIPVSISGALHRDRHGKVVGSVITLRDISDQKRLEAQFHRSQKMESIGTLAGGIAHDFNNLLMGIQGRTSLILRDLDEGHPHFEHLKGIEDYVRSAAELTRQLLGFARGGKYEVKPTNLNQIVRQSSELFARTKKEIKVHTEFQDDLWSVEVDQGQIEQVLLNLYVNAWQAMTAGGELHLQTENLHLSEDQVKPYGLEPGKYVKVSVMDNGSGIDEDVLDRIFDPFFTTKEMGRGTGLGLASAYGIVKNHRGVINVFSKKEKGTTFNIYLPVSEKKVRREERQLEGILGGTETVLLVDDEEMILEVGKLMLEHLGYRVLTAGGGEEAIRIYREQGREQDQRIELVILDMIMPGTSGGVTYEKLREIDRGVKVLLASGYSMDDQASDILERGCNGFIQKPFNLKRMSQKIREILES